MDQALQDLRQAVRRLASSPAFSIAVVAILALGIGATSATFSVVNGVLLRPLPYEDAARLVWAGGSLPDLEELRAGCPALSSAAFFATNLYDVRGAGAPDEVRGVVGSPELFDVLGVRPALGRPFGARDDHEPLVVVSHAFWQARLGGDPRALGRTLSLSGRMHTVVGVMPPAFRFPSSEYDLWVPLGGSLAQTPGQAQNRGLRIFRAVGRLAPGSSAAQLAAQAEAVGARLAREHPDTNAGGAPSFVPLAERMLGDARPALLVLLCAVGLVWLIACANVSGLLLARQAGRQRELAVRLALGAGVWRLVRQLLTESLVLAGSGAAAGWLLAAWCVRLLPRFAPARLPRVEAVRLDGAVLAFTLLATLLAALLVGLLPALQARHVRAGALREGGRASADPRTRRLRDAAVALEVALSLTLAVGAGLLLRSLAGLMRVDGGFVAARSLAFNVKNASPGASPAEASRLAAKLIERLRELPGVRAAGGATSLPPDVLQRRTGFVGEGMQAGGAPLEADFVAATPGLFEALGTPVLRGRGFADADTPGSGRVVVVNQGLARRVFSGADPLGRRLRLVNPEQEPEWRTIVGVVADVRFRGLQREADLQIYTPLSQTPFPWLYVVVRGEGDLSPLAAALPAVAQGVDPRLAPAGLRTLDERVAESLGQPRFNAVLLAAFAALAVLLAAAGVQGIVAHSVAVRAREIGLRVALGATRASVLRLVLRQGLRPVWAGTAAGLVGALLASRALESLLFGVRPADPLTFVCVAASLVGVSAVAALGPASRALAVDPAIVLRAD